MNKRAEYDSADWSKSDAAIAKILGVTRQAVSAARLVRGIKSAKGHGGKRDGAGRKARDKKTNVERVAEALRLRGHLVKVITLQVADYLAWLAETNLPNTDANRAVWASLQFS